MKNLFREFLDSFTNSKAIGVEDCLYWSARLKEETGLDILAEHFTMFINELEAAGFISLNMFKDENGKDKLLATKKVINGN